MTGDMPGLERLPGDLVASYRLFDLLLGRLMEAIGDDAVVFLELPVTAHAPGRCLGEVFEPGTLAPLRRVASYSWYRPNAGRSGEPSRELEEEELRRLRALGYVN